MLLLLCIILFTLNICSFYLFNVEHINNQLSKSEKRKFFREDKNILSKLFFIKKCKQSNPIYWFMNFINNICVLFGVVVFISFPKDNIFCNYMGLLLVFFIVGNFILAIIVKLLIHIIESKSILVLSFLFFILIMYVLGITTIFHKIL